MSNLDQQIKQLEEDNARLRIEVQILEAQVAELQRALEETTARF